MIFVFSSVIRSITLPLRRVTDRQFASRSRYALGRHRRQSTRPPSYNPAITSHRDLCHDIQRSSMEVYLIMLIHMLPIKTTVYKWKLYSNSHMHSALLQKRARVGQIL